MRLGRVNQTRSLHADAGGDAGAFRADDLVLSKYVVVTQPFIDPFDNLEKTILFGLRGAEWTVIRQDRWLQQTGSAWNRDQAFAQELYRRKILVPKGEDELKSVLEENLAATHAYDVLYVVVQPTASCQFGCDYCGQDHASHRISPRHQSLLVERVRAKLETRRFRHLHIGWFGGEPLDAIPVIRSLTAELRQVAREADCEYSARMATNGFALTPSIALELVTEHSLKFIEVTLDGPEDYHDSRRALKDGSPTFQRVFGQICRMVSLPELAGRIRVRCNVDRRNKNGIVPLLELLAASGLHSWLASFYVAPVHSWGNDAHRNVSKRAFADWQIECFAHMIRLGFNTKILPTRRRVICTAFRPLAQVIDAYGQLFNCSEVSYVPAYEGRAGRRTAASAQGLSRTEKALLSEPPNGCWNLFAIGHLEHGESEGRREVLADFWARVEARRYPCHQCRMLPVCGGACPRLWLEGIRPCPAEYHNLERRLLLNYLASRSSITCVEVSEKESWE